jgi:hypothetical protein
MLGAGRAQLTASRRRDGGAAPGEELGPGCPNGFTAPSRGRDVNAAKADHDLTASDRRSVAKHAHGGFLG